MNDAPNSALVHYDAACPALADCSRVDEVKGIHDKATAIKAYAKQAENQQLIADAERIIWRARERLGELLADSERNTGAMGIGTGAVQNFDSTPPTLVQLGMSRNLSSLAQRLSAIPEEEKEPAFAAREPEKALKGLLARKQRESGHSEIAERAVAAQLDSVAHPVSPR